MEQLFVDSHEIADGKHWIGTSSEGGGCWIELPQNNDDLFKIITIPQYGGVPCVQEETKTLQEAMTKAVEYST